MSPTKRKKASCEDSSSKARGGCSGKNSKKKRCLELQDGDNTNGSKPTNPAPVVPGFEERVADSVVLLNIFPAEIWTMITDNVREHNSHEDVENMSNACLYFRRFFMHDRVHCLFPKVLKILKGSSGSEQSDLLGCDVLMCRQVCTSWNKVVEHFYERNPAHFEMDTGEGSTVNAVITGDNFSTVSFSRCDTLIDFMDHFKQTHIFTVDGTSKNPFLGRSVAFYPRRQRALESNGRAAAAPVAGPSNAFLVAHGDDNEENSFRNAVFNLNVRFREVSESVRELSDRIEDMLQLYEARITTLLKKYGRHIWYGTIELPASSQRQAPTDVYAILRSWMRLMPNLKVLSVSFSGTERYPVQLIRKISRFKLPKLPNLQFLKTDNICSPIFNELLRANHHIRKLQMKNARGDYCIFAPSSRLFNLKGLSITVSAAQHLLTFTNIPTSGDWDLDELHILLSEETSVEDTVFVNWSKLWQLVQTKWGNGLTRLELHLPEPSDSTEETKILEESFTFKWNVPHLTHLTLKLSSTAYIDFLLPLKDSLESLHVDCQEEKSNKKRAKNTMQLKRIQAEQKIQFLGYMERMNKSNIWTIFLNLKEIRITRKTDQFDRTFLRTGD